MATQSTSKITLPPTLVLQTHVAVTLEIEYYSSKIHKSSVQLAHSFSYSASRIWNELPLEIRTSPTLSSFHSNLKSHLFRLAYPP